MKSMKHNRLLTVVTALVLLMALCFTFASCGIAKDKEKTPEELFFETNEIVPVKTISSKLGFGSTALLSAERLKQSASLTINSVSMMNASLLAQPMKFSLEALQNKESVSGTLGYNYGTDTASILFASGNKSYVKVDGLFDKYLSIEGKDLLNTVVGSAATLPTSGVASLQGIDWEAFFKEIQQILTDNLDKSWLTVTENVSLSVSDKTLTVSKGEVVMDADKIVTYLTAVFNALKTNETMKKLYALSNSDATLEEALDKMISDMADDKNNIKSITIDKYFNGQELAGLDVIATDVNDKKIEWTSRFATIDGTTYCMADMKMNIEEDKQNAVSFNATCTDTKLDATVVADSAKITLTADIAKQDNTVTTAGTLAFVGGEDNTFSIPFTLKVLENSDTRNQIELNVAASVNGLSFDVTCALTTEKTTEVPTMPADDAVYTEEEKNSLTDSESFMTAAQTFIQEKIPQTYALLMQLFSTAIE